MSLTRHLRSLLADPRRETASVLTVMFLVLAVVSVHVLCNVHLDEPAQSAGHSHQAPVPDAEQASAPTSVVEAAPAPLGGGSHGCSDHHSATAQCDPVTPTSPGPAVAPTSSVQWLVSDLAHAERAARHIGTVAAAPSLTALGISRT
ncbi:hypothetical protein [Antribacter gilvus]|uniref:hypothetical protein n=1 Tax=Antribacter gilvus TaxID=2304675 RepID=UPI000F789FF1|nr:hypothetical protein [Antribacter gilvus]